MFKILFLGDIVGKVGRKVVSEQLISLKNEFQPDLIIANGENSSGGFGIEYRTADEILHSGVDFITTGNHVWNKREVVKLLNDRSDKIIRPINFPEGAAGVGYAIFHHQNGVKVGIINAMGRVFMSELLDCPFRKIEKLLETEKNNVDFFFLDFHAEATSEKIALAHFLDGKVSAMVGTHTHVQTADERILPQGLGYISDAGMCGPYHSVIGAEVEGIVQRFLTGLPMRYNVAKGDAMINGVFFAVELKTKQAKIITRINRVFQA